MKIGEYVISTFPIMLAIGVVGMYLCAYRRRTLFSLNFWQCGIFTILLTLTGVSGALLMFFFETGVFGGVSFYGSVFLIPLLMPLIGMLFRLKPWQSMDLCAPCVAIMIACLRINCYLSGCCGAHPIFVFGYQVVIPVQLVEALLDVLILVVLLLCEKNSKCQRRFYPFFMIAYGTMRFFIEFLRNTPKDWLSLSHGQWFSISSIIIGLAWWAWAMRGMENDNSA